MSFIIKENETLKERIYINELSSGVKCYIFPKSGFGEKEAVFAVKYGSKDVVFQENGTKYRAPYGTAHFLEHKLFEEEGGNVFNDFVKEGAMANAFTDFNKTAYYFQSRNHFESNFRRLIQFVQSPYFTDESADREKGIIEQEISMYDD